MTVSIKTSLEKEEHFLCMQSFTVGSRLSKVMCAQMKYMLLRLFVYIYITNAGMH